MTLKAKVNFFWSRSTSLFFSILFSHPKFPSGWDGGAAFWRKFFCFLTKKLFNSQMTNFLALLRKFVYYTAKWRKSEIRRKISPSCQMTKKVVPPKEIFPLVRQQVDFGRPLLDVLPYKPHQSTPMHDKHDPNKNIKKPLKNFSSSLGPAVCRTVPLPLAAKDCQGSHFLGAWLKLCKKSIPLKLTIVFWRKTWAGLFNAKVNDRSKWSQWDWVWTVW